MIEQRSQEWFRQRVGLIAASEFHCLMKDHKEDVPLTNDEIEAYKTEHPKSRNIPTTKKVNMPFSDATYTYLNRKIMERYIPKNGTLDEYIEDRTVSSRAMDYGTLMESSARNRYAAETNSEVIEVEFLPLEGYEKFCGVSADGIVRSKDGGIEIKCPFLIEHHLEYLLMGKPEDLLELKPEYYWQIHLNMLAWDRAWWDFVSYCPYVSKSKQIKILRIYRDNTIDKEIVSRISLAVAYMKKKMQQINEVQTKIL